MNKNNNGHVASEQDVEIENPPLLMKNELYRLQTDLNEEEKIKRTIDVYYYDDTKIITYSSPSILEMTKSIPNKDVDEDNNKQYFTYEYIPSPQFHKLHHVYATIKFSEIRVAPEYADYVQIKVCKNFAHNVVVQASMILPQKGDVTEGVYIHTVDTFYHDSYREKECINVKQYDEMIGNRKELRKWSTVLKTYDELCLPFRFFTDKSDKFAIPIHMYTNPSVKISVTYCLSLSNLLRMRVKNSEGNWVVIKPNFNFLEGNIKELNAPKVWGIYRMVPKDAVTNEKDGYRILITDIKYMPEQEIKKEHSINLTDEHLVVRSIRYGFLNCKAALFNNLSNYSLEHVKENNGNDPQEDYSLNHGNVPRTSKRSTVHSTLIPNHYFFLSNTISKCIHDIRFDFSPHNIYPDTGIVMNKISMLTFTLRGDKNKKKNTENTKPILKINYQDPEDAIKTVIKNQKRSMSEQDLDNSVSEKFILKGYCEVFKYLTFKVGTVIVEE